MSGCKNTSIQLPKSGLRGPQGPAGEPGVAGATGATGATGADGGQEIYQAEKIVYNTEFVPPQINGAAISSSNPHTATILTQTELSPAAGLNQTVGGLLKNVFYLNGNGQDSSGPYDFKYTIWYRQSLNGGIFTTPCVDASQSGLVERVFIDPNDNALKIIVNTSGNYRMIIVG
jgi:hypothetical protein